ncbi:hypothetical protein [Lysobacter antibioticus]|uniref:hypothetical protein n=1 Tax=Lysobacter antibioticus TaxID=84531 RepID=UPI000B33BB17|nr:hypothetical protein [Lysobacter antibioticus]
MDIRAKSRLRFRAVLSVGGVLLTSLLMNACDGSLQTSTPAQRPKSTSSPQSGSQHPLSERSDESVSGARRCPRGKEVDAVYALVGATLFKYPRANTVQSVGRSPGNTHRSDEGGANDAGYCAEVPARVQVLDLKDVFERDQGPYAQQFGLLTSISLIGTSDGSSAMQDVSERASDRFVNMAVCKNLKNGLQGCSVGSDFEHAQVSTFRGDSRGYTAPQGRRYIVLCGLGPTISPDDCHVYYRLYRGVSLSYGFDKSRLPVDKILEVDAALRRKVNALAVVERN